MKTRPPLACLAVVLLSLPLAGFAPTGARWLLIGDSHSDFNGNARGSFGFFGQHLQELIPRLSVYAVSGSTPSWWVDRTQAKWGCTVAVAGSKAGGCSLTPRLSDLAPGYDVVVFEQGANMHGMSRSKVQSQVREVLAAAGSRKCYWVGPPNAPTSIYSRAEQDALESELSSMVAPCTYLSSRAYPFEAGSTHDEHLSMRAAGAWAEGIAKKLIP